MAQRYACGFESSTVPSGYTNSGGAATITSATDQHNGGARSLKLVSTAGAWVVAVPVGYTADAGSDEMQVQVAFRVGDAPNSAAQGFLSLQMGSGTFIDVFVTAAGAIQVYRSPLQLFGSFTLGSASSTGLITANAWHVMWTRVVPGTGSDGTVEVWLNGTRVLNLTGVTTSNGLGTARGLAIARPTFANGNTWLDDIVVQDSTWGTPTTVLADVASGSTPRLGLGLAPLGLS